MKFVQVSDDLYNTIQILKKVYIKWMKQKRKQKILMVHSVIKM